MPESIDIFNKCPNYANTGAFINLKKFTNHKGALYSLTKIQFGWIVAINLCDFFIYKNVHTQIKGNCK